MPGTTETDLTSATTLLREVGVVAAAYQVLDEVVARHHAVDAWMVLRPAGRRPQIFSSGRRAVAADVLSDLLERPTGVYLDPVSGTPAGAGLAVLFESAFRAEAADREATVDVRWGLAGRRSTENAVARAAAAGARYGWHTCAVLLTTGGAVPADERWQALALAVRSAVRSGDEAGMVSEGIAVALLGGHEGSDVARPFLTRLRAELSRVDARHIELHAATASTPADSVDPAELWRLAAVRLADLGIGTDPSGLLEPDELHLRTSPDVVCVSLDGPRLVAMTWPPASAEGERLNGAYGGAMATSNGGPEVLVDPGPAALVATAGPAGSNGIAPQVNGLAAVVSGNGSHGNGATLAALDTPATGVQPVEHQVHGNGHAVPLVSASAPGEEPDADGEEPDADGEAVRGRSRGPRIELAGAHFDREQGLSEVFLSRGGLHSHGKAPAGPLAGGAQATLLALRALGIDVPFYLVSAERVRAVPGEPVVVMLAPRRSGGTAGADERIGIARASDDVEAASRATLNALNRFLSQPPST